MYTLYTDGGSRGNPGISACAFVLLKKEQIIEIESKYIGISTNNYAEYSGLKMGIDYFSKKYNTEELQIYMDSELIVKQITGEYKIKSEELQKLNSHIWKNLSKIKFKIQHIPRSKNYIADKLVNIVLDTKELIN